MDSLDVPTDHTREPPYRQLALALRGTYDVPALLGQLPKKLSRRLEIQYLALVLPRLRYLGRRSQSPFQSGCKVMVR